MLASNPASMMNQNSTDLGMQNRFNLSSSRFRLLSDALASCLLPRRSPDTLALGNRKRMVTKANHSFGSNRTLYSISNMFDVKGIHGKTNECPQACIDVRVD
jgi:hypothetical protein